MKKINVFSGLKDFLILWSSQTVSSLGTSMTNFALAIWVYNQSGTASSLTLMTICLFLPTILFRFIAGTMADRWNKKRIMLFCDLVAASGTLTILILYSSFSLQVWHLYLINFLLSFMDSFQVTASTVATSLLVPQEQYTRVSGLQSFSSSAVSILAPALGSALLALGGLKIVLILDLVSFAIAFITLLVFIKIPDIQHDTDTNTESFWKSCLEGIRFLQKNAALFRIILFVAAINFFAKLGGDGLMSVFVLSKSGGDQNALGMVETANALAALTGSLLVMCMKPAVHKTKAVFISCAITFLVGNALLSLSDSLWFWIATSFISYVTATIFGTNLTVIMRTHVPIHMQGRVFSAQGTIQNASIPLGLFLGGVLADHVFEPFMMNPSFVQQGLSFLFGSGKGSGVAVIFFVVGIIGFIISIVALKNPLYKTLDQNQDKDL